MSALGAVLKRNAWVDQVDWKIYPNLSILLVGPSGIGKDTAIDAAEEIIQEVNTLPIIVGKTMEYINQEMVNFGDPACCFIPAPEVTAFIGAKDYQKGMVQELTHLLTTKNYVDVSTSGKGKLRIKRPTVTLQAGSTVDWLHKAMPEGSLEGGLWPRFLIVYEEYGSKCIPLVKNLPKHEVDGARKYKHAFMEACKFLHEEFKDKPKEIQILNEAAELYENWYRNRFKLFSATVQPYANRSRDQILRLAMLCAISRRHDYIEGVDMQFAIELMQFVATTIDKAMVPPTTETRLARIIRKILPCNMKIIMSTLGSNNKRRDINEAIAFMLQGGLMKYNKESGLYEWEGD